MSETRMLPCTLTSSEVQARGKELAKLVDLRVAKEEQKKAESKALKEEIVRMATIVHTGREDRAVEVTEVPSLENRVIETYRTDTHELVSSRAMTPTEVAEHQQKAIPFNALEGGKKGKKQAEA